ncbi:MAG: hypothetical protein H7039_19780 [Bryobacteraceae bacterium]|nr:hypothetical protein [Bryobacteraceae bacterium]
MGRLKRFLTNRIPKLNNVVFVESGDREVSERILPALYSQCPYVDLVTCFGSAPGAFDPARGVVYDIGLYPGKEGRNRLFAELRAKHYSAVGIMCADLPIMFKWKWVIAAQLPGKLFIVNENSDYFWVDRANWQIVRKFILFRFGLSGADAARTLTQLALFPFTVAYLLMYAGWVHGHRAIRRGLTVR